jgi:hypothetical protein
LKRGQVPHAADADGTQDESGGIGAPNPRRSNV